MINRKEEKEVNKSATDVTKRQKQEEGTSSIFTRLDY